MAEKSAVRLQGIAKSYKIYPSRSDRLKEALHPLKKKYHQDFFALDGIDLVIPERQSLGIIGFNGSGKSTLLKVICGILQPTRGSVEAKGTISALLELGSSFNPEFTGRENVYFTGSLYGFSRQEMNRRYPEIVDFANIGRFLDQPVKSYSSGMLVRLAFAVAINVSPDILIIDEALAVGDIRFQQKCVSRIKELQARCTVIMVSHNLNSIMALCDRAVWMHNGRLIEDGIPKEVVQKYTKAVYEGMDNYLAEKEKGRDRAEEIVQPPDKKEPFTFGRGQGSIRSYRLVASDRGTSNAAWGGEAVALEVDLEVVKDIDNPILGFEVRNKLGIEIFGYNTSFSGPGLPPLRRGQPMTAVFRFTWPHLVTGAYSVNLALADEENGNIVQHHYVNDALIIESLMSVNMTGLMGLPDMVVEVGPARA